MIHAQLSDAEKEDLLALTVSGKPANVVAYVNKLLKERNLGHDSCARPLAVRDKKHIKQPCFAIEYIEKIEEFLNESLHRTTPVQAISETKEYIQQVKAEIKKFFS